MIVQALDIENYRGIKKLNMKFNDGINIVIGNNGAGKTSLLNALAETLSQPLQLLQGISKIMSIEKDVRLTTEVIGGVVKQSVSHFPVKISSTVIYNNTEYICDQVAYSEVSGTEFKHYDLMQTFKTDFGNALKRFPILCFLRAGRGQVIRQDNTSVMLTPGEVQRVYGYKNAFEDRLNIDDIQKWCFQMDFAEYQDKLPIREYAEFQSIIGRFFSIIDEKTRDSKIYYSGKKGAIVFNDGLEECPLYQLSAGYQAILCMIIELSYRAVLLNPKLENVAENTTGIVLIDEIEMHLHPAWQWKILEALHGTFPKVQFIIATHSPIILSSASNASVFLMKSPNEVVFLGDAYGYSINDVLTLLQASEYQPTRINDFYRKAEIILEQGDESELENLLQKASSELRDTPEILKNFLEFVEINRWAEDA